MQVILSTARDLQEAKKIAKRLLQHRLAACVNIIPTITSMYIWKDEIVEDQEVMLIIKAIDFHKVQRAIQEIHSYEVPEIIAFDIDDGSNQYLGWIREVLLQ